MYKHVHNVEHAPQPCVSEPYPRDRAHARYLDHFINAPCQYDSKHYPRGTACNTFQLGVHNGAHMDSTSFHNAIPPAGNAAAGMPVCRKYGHAEIRAWRMCGNGGHAEHAHAIMIMRRSHIKCWNTRMRTCAYGFRKKSTTPVTCNTDHDIRYTDSFLSHPSFLLPAQDAPP